MRSLDIEYVLCLKNVSCHQVCHLALYSGRAALAPHSPGRRVNVWIRPTPCVLCLKKVFCYLPLVYYRYHSYYIHNILEFLD